MNRLIPYYRARYYSPCVKKRKKGRAPAALNSPVPKLNLGTRNNECELALARRAGFARVVLDALEHRSQEDGQGDQGSKLLGFRQHDLVPNLDRAGVVRNLAAEVDRFIGRTRTLHERHGANF